MGILHHNVDNCGDKFLQDTGSIPNLVAVHFAFPGCTAMNELVAQHIKAVKQNTDKYGGVFFSQGLFCELPALLKFTLPLIFSQPTVMVVPEVAGYILVVNKEPDFTGVILPDNVVIKLF